MDLEETVAVAAMASAALAAATAPASSLFCCFFSAVATAQTATVDADAKMFQ